MSEKNSSSTRKLYTFRPSGPEAAASILGELLSILQPVFATVDAYPNREWRSFRDLPLAVRSAQTRLEIIGRADNPDAKDPLMGIRLGLDTEDHCELLQIFGPYSIALELQDASQVPVAGVDDEGSSGWSYLTEAEATTLLENLRALGVNDLQFKEARPRGFVSHWFRNVALVAILYVLSLFLERRGEDDPLFAIALVIFGAFLLVPVTRWRERRMSAKKWEVPTEAQFFCSIRVASGVWAGLSPRWVTGSAMLKNAGIVFKKRLRLWQRGIHVPVNEISRRDTRAVEGIWESFWVNSAAKIIELEARGAKLELAILPKDFGQVIALLPTRPR